MEDEDGEVERCCRICRGPEEEEADGEEAGEALGKLIRPCACKGSLLYVHEKCQEMWIKTYIRRSDKKPACEVCGQQFRISFTQPHKGLVGFLFSSQSPPLVHAIYLSLLYIGLYCLFLFAAEHHTKLAAFCVMVAVGVGASAAIFYLIAFREVDRQVLVYYIVPTFVFAIIIFSQFMGYASLYYKWLSYPGLSLEEDLEYKAFLQQLTWKSSMGVLLEGISSTSIVLNIGLLLCVSSVRLYNFLRHLRRHGGSLANVWMTAPDSTRATIIGSVQLCIFCWFYVCGPTGKCAVFLVYVAFVAVNWLLRSRFSRVPFPFTTERKRAPNTKASKRRQPERLRLLLRPDDHERQATTSGGRRPRAADFSDDHEQRTSATTTSGRLQRRPQAARAADFGARPTSGRRPQG